MNIEKHYERYGPPDIKLANVEFWIHGYQFPEIDDNDDANWLTVTVLCKSQKSFVLTDESIIQTYDLQGFLKEIEKSYKTMTGKAELAPLEPNLHIELQFKSRGQIEMEVSITPDNMAEEHKFTFEIDQSYLPDFQRQCKQVLEKFPTKV